MFYKANENENAAYLLKQCGFYAGSVNRSYYAVYQTVLTFHNTTSSMIENERSHENTIKDFCNKFNDFKLGKRVQNNMKELKDLKKKADYLADEISEKDAVQAIKKCRAIRQEIVAHRREF